MTMDGPDGRALNQLSASEIAKRVAAGEITAEAVARLVSGLLADASGRQSIGGAARASVQERFTNGVRAAALMDVYRTVLARRDPGTAS